MRRLLIGMVLTFSLASCASEPASNVEATAESTSQEELAAWAGDLCAATDRLQTVVSGLTDSIEFDLSAGLDQLPQIYDQLQMRVGEIDSSIDDVEVVLANAPESSQQAGIFAAQVQALVSSARASGNDALSAAGQAVNADGFIGAGVAVASAVAAAQQAYEDANAARTLLEGARNGSERDLSEAFAAAPECQSPQ